MNNGWICPKCGRVYAPFIPECQHCNEKVESISNNTIISDNGTEVHLDAVFDSLKEAQRFCGLNLRRESNKTRDNCI